MKIKTKNLSYDEVIALPKYKRIKPFRRSYLLGLLIGLIGKSDLKATNFTYTISPEAQKDLDNGPCLILMNHSSFIDLEMVNAILFPRSYHIVTTSDGFVGKELLMRLIGCIPTQKFVTDVSLIADMEYVINHLHSSVLMYPEASYSFDGTATLPPKRMGILFRKLNCPVISIFAEGAFLRDPLYNCLQKRNVQTKATVSELFSAEEIATFSVSEMDDRIKKFFSFDHFRTQQDEKISVIEPFRADGLQRILYQCNQCKTEGEMEGRGTTICCNHCGKTYTLDEFGHLVPNDGIGPMEHIPAWYAKERQAVKESLLNGSYLLDTDVTIAIMRDMKAIYFVGEGHLTHTTDGFHLTGLGDLKDKIDYFQAPEACYGLYADFYWYELGDIICIGNQDMLYYLFPKKIDIVAKTRLAVEELYKIKKGQLK